MLPGSELSAVTEDAKLRPGAAIEIYSKTQELWLPGQVVAPDGDSKVMVEFRVKGEVVRKSIRPDSEGLRPPSANVDERLPSQSRKSAQRDPSHNEAMKQLQAMEEREQELLAVSVVDERSRADVKWSHAHKNAHRSSSIELWCSGREDLNGTYVLVDGPQPSGPPVYRHRTRGEQWLFVATCGSWWVADEECVDQKTARGWLRSPPVKPGTLPFAVTSWEVPKSGEWEPQDSARFWLSESVLVSWQRLRVAAFETPVIEVKGVSDGFVDGLFDFILCDGEPGAAPAFQHQQRPNLWLFQARDQRWWFGSTSAKDRREDLGLLHSAPVQPGTHPKDARGWHVRNAKIWEECRGISVRVLPKAKRASEKWARACERAEQVQIWGKEYYHGEYTLGGNVDGVPAYQYKCDPGVWLYLAMDGCWWLADTVHKDARRARGYLRSDVVEPGTLPQDVAVWRDLRIGSWEANDMVRVLVPHNVEEEWMAAWKSVNKEGCDVIEVAGVWGADINGMYDLVLTGSQSSRHGPGQRHAPSFQHQINQELFLFLGRDGRWWVSDERCMHLRDPKGRMHSDLIRPGMLPTSKQLTWHVHNTKSKEWERQNEILIE